MMAAIALLGTNAAVAKKNSSNPSNPSSRSFSSSSSRNSLSNTGISGGSQFKLNTPPRVNLGAIASSNFQSNNRNAIHRQIPSNLGQQSNNLSFKNGIQHNNAQFKPQVLNNLGVNGSSLQHKKGNVQISLGNNHSKLAVGNVNKHALHLGNHHANHLHHGWHDGWWHDDCWHDDCWHGDCWHDDCWHFGHYYDGCYHPYNLYVIDAVAVPRRYEPFHCNYFVNPGDTWYLISMKEYGTADNATFIARFNGMTTFSPLVVGQQLMLPTISTTGALTASQAPAMEMPQVAAEAPAATSEEGPSVSGAATSANVAPKEAAETVRPKMAVGSTLLIDGATFGEKPGKAQLRMGGATLKVEVVEWTTNAVKIRLPRLELAGTSNGDIEIVRADGVVVTQAAIELVAATELAHAP